LKSAANSGLWECEAFSVSIYSKVSPQSSSPYQSSARVQRVALCLPQHLPIADSLLPFAHAPPKEILPSQATGWVTSNTGLFSLNAVLSTAQEFSSSCNPVPDILPLHAIHPLSGSISRASLLFPFRLFLRSGEKSKPIAQAQKACRTWKRRSPAGQLNCRAPLRLSIRCCHAAQAATFAFGVVFSWRATSLRRLRRGPFQPVGFPYTEASAVLSVLSLLTSRFTPCGSSACLLAE
jgi:hypothetical protein